LKFDPSLSIDQIAALMAAQLKNDFANAACVRDAASGLPVGWSQKRIVARAVSACLPLEIESEKLRREQFGATAPPQDVKAEETSFAAGVIHDMKAAPAS
jgi:hypothetical protein